MANLKPSVRVNNRRKEDGTTKISLTGGSVLRQSKGM
jgi:hypothetical protein